MSKHIDEDTEARESHATVTADSENGSSADAPSAVASAAAESVTADAQEGVRDPALDETGQEGSALDGDTGASSTARMSRKEHLEREGEIAADFLETLLDICDLDGDLDVDIDGDRAAVSIVDSDEGRVPRRLVGPNGEVLEALQDLARLAVQASTGERSRLMLDVAGHRAERRSQLVALASAAVAEVRSTGERKPLLPMTAFERKVVHDEVLAAGLASESEGVEPRRFVVILPR
ncbi:MAG: protein jag [Dermatophilaceae bacterium]